MPQQASHLRQVFAESRLSKSSMLILDDLEGMLSWSRVLGQPAMYSNVVLQALRSLAKMPPRDGHKLAIIGTCTDIKVLQQLGLAQASV